MPPEPLPWDRKDFFKDRKHERSESSFLGSTPRWRDSYSSHYGSSREFARWGGSNEFRRPPGHGKQGGWHLFAEESGNGHLPSRSCDMMLDDESCRPSVVQGDGKYGRNSRENKWSSSQRDCKGHYSWEVNNGSPNTPVRQHDVINDQRSLDDISHPPHSDYVSTGDQLQMKDHHDSHKLVGVNGLGTGQRDRENSLDWKPLKWTRSGSLSSRGSGFSHSSSSKSLGGVDSNEGKCDLQLKSVVPINSPSGDAAACATSAVPFEDTSSRKKPRLNWGEGLAKYEKKKVEGPDMSVSKYGAAVSATNAEPMHSQSSNLVDKSPRVMGFSDCASPATPSSFACSSSPGIEEKSFGKTINVDNDVSNLCCSPSIGSHSHLEGFSFNLEKLDIGLVANMCCSVVELLQSDDPSSVDSSFVRSTAMNKLLVWKGDVSKALETTEFEIDSLENELKTLKHESGNGCPCPAASCSFPEEGNPEPCFEQGAAFIAPRPCPLQVASCGEGIVEKIPQCNGDLVEAHTGVKDDDIDSPGTATSKFIELSLVKHDECLSNLDVQSTSMDLKCSQPPAIEEESTKLACGKVSREPFSGGVNFQTDGENDLCNLIFASNKESAKRAFEIFNQLLHADRYKIEFPGISNVPLRQSDALKEKFALRKRFLRFKERVVNIKFKAFQHLWKEDMHLLAIRKHRSRSQKKWELSLRTTPNGYQNHRSSIRSRFSSPAGNLSLVPTTEILNFTSKLLSDSQVKLYRNALKMPALILDEKEKMASRFISSNGLVEDPCAVEKERAMINPWTSREREIFLEKLGSFGKDFRKIAAFLEHKTTADCVEFYYKKHKSDGFEKTKTVKQVKSSSSFLVDSGKRWNREMNAASLDILGEVSVMAADADNAMGSRQMCSRRILLGGYGDSKISQGDDGILERSSNLDAGGNYSEIVAADVLAGICGSVSEAMGSCITTSVDPGEVCGEHKCQKVDSVIKQHSNSDVTQVDEETCSDESCGEMDPTDWTDEEKSVFMQAVSSYGKDFSMISRCVRTRSRDQCKVFFSKARKCLGLDLIQQGPGNLGTPVSDDANGGGSDTEDACAVENGLVICSDKLGFRIDGDLPLSVLNPKQREYHAEGRMDLHADLISFEEDNMKKLLGKKDSKAAETLDCDAFPREHAPELTSGVGTKIMNGKIHQSESLQVQKVLIESVDAETERDQATGDGISVAAGERSIYVDDAVPSSPNSMVEVKAVAEVSVAGNDLEGQEPLLPGSSLSSRRCLVQESSTAQNASCRPVDMGSCSNFSFGVANMNQASVELDSVEKPPPGSQPRENDLTTKETVLQDSASVQCERILDQDGLAAAIDLQEIKDEHCKNSVGREDCFKHLPAHPLFNHNESSLILRGYPLQIQTKKEMNGDISCKALSEVQGLLNSERSFAMVQDCFLQKCNKKAQCSVPALPLLSQHTEKASDHPRDHLRSVSDTEKPSRNGDVKLFGKILSNSSSFQNSNSNTHENDEKVNHQPKPSSKSSAFDFTGHHDKDENTALLKFDSHNYPVLENVPMSYGFWDRNRIQTGFSSVPDSTVLLAKYPAAFSNYHGSSSKMEQMQAVVKNNDHNLNGVSVLPSREISGGNGVIDYQMHRSHDGSKVLPFTVEMKQRPEIFSEMQRRNGFDAISSLQQQGRGTIGMTVGGRGGILVAGPCTGVSDPVAAIKMHFAKTDHHGVQTGTSVREDDCWRGQGDIGR